MRIGIKYCGGCNPGYNRVALVDRLINKYSNYTFEPAQAGVGYDVLIVVNGCLRSCVNYELLKGKKTIIIDSNVDSIEL